MRQFLAKYRATVVYIVFAAVAILFLYLRQESVEDRVTTVENVIRPCDTREERRGAVCRAEALQTVLACIHYKPCRETITRREHPRERIENIVRERLEDLRDRLPESIEGGDAPGPPPGAGLPSGQGGPLFIRLVTNIGEGK